MKKYVEVDREPVVFAVVEEYTEFTKSDLKPCMVVRLRDGDLYIVGMTKDCKICIDKTNGTYAQYDYNINENMTNNKDKNLDIMEVYSSTDYASDCHKLSINGRTLLYKRTESSPRDIKIKELQDKMKEIEREMEELR